MTASNSEQSVDWVNGIIEIVVPLEDVLPEHTAGEKLGAAELLLDDLIDKLGPQWADAAFAVRWQDAAGDESLEPLRREAQG